VHVDQGVSARGVLTADKDRVRVAHQPDVGQALVGIRPGDRELARQIVIRDRYPSTPKLIDMTLAPGLPGTRTCHRFAR
jgi:hypothetical protein